MNSLRFTKIDYRYFCLIYIALLYPFSDFISVAFETFSFFSSFIRAGSLLLILFLLVKVKLSVTYYLAFLFFLFFVMVGTALIVSFDYVSTNVQVLFKVSLPFILMVLLKSEIHFERYLFLGVIFYSLYIASVVLTPLIGAEAFYTYDDNARFGFKGFIPAGNEASGLLLTALFFSHLISGFVPKFVCMTFRFGVVLSLILLGTKAGLLCLVLFYSTRFLMGKKMLGFFYLITIFSLIYFLGMFFYLSFDYINVAVDSYLNFFIWAFDNIAKGSVLTLVLSSRDLLLVSLYENYYNTLWLSLLFGGWPISIYPVEMDFIDLLHFFGGPLLVIYMGGWFLIISNFWKETDKAETVFFPFLCTWFFMSFFAGHLFTSAVVAPGILFCLAVLRYRNSMKCEFVS